MFLICAALVGCDFGGSETSTDPSQTDPAQTESTQEDPTDTDPTETEDDDPTQQEEEEEPEPEPIRVQLTDVQQTLDLDRFISAWGSYPAGTGKRFVIVTAELSNLTAEQDVVAIFTGFSVKTDTGLTVSASEMSLSIDGVCAGDISLGQGASLPCATVFEVPLDAQPTALVFTTPTGESGQTPISLTPCEWCGDECYDTQTHPEHCGSCYNAVNFNQECVGGEPACTDSAETMCGTRCVDLLTDRDHCGECFQGVLSGQICVDGEGECYFLQEKVCDDACVDVRTSTAHCGACGQDCGVGECVSPGECEAELRVTSRTTTCESACSAEGYACIGGVAAYEQGFTTYYSFINVTCDQVPSSSYGSKTFRFTQCDCEKSF